MKKNDIIITVDGPVASGKSTVAFMLARQLGFNCLSSGLLFRSLAYILSTKYHYAVEQLVDVSAHDIDEALLQDHFVYQPHDRYCGALVFEGMVLNPLLKTAVIDKQASVLATNEYVRKSLLLVQRRIVSGHNTVVEGRDTGSVVFPDADVKFFLTADAHVRASRWQHDQQNKGFFVSLHEALIIIQERDERDRNRAKSPLIVPDEAFVIDNSSLTQDQTIALMRANIKEKLTI